MESTRSGFFGIFGLILGVIFIFLILNYFNILSLSTLYPKYFGSLPHAPYNFISRTPQEKKIPICPVSKEFCKTGVPIYDGSKFLGIGYKLPIGNKIFTSIPGTAVFGGTEDKSAGILSHAKITIGGSDPWQGYTATYEYFGLPIQGNTQTGSVFQGAQLGAVWGGKFPDKSPYNGINVLVLVQSKNGQNILEFK